MRAEPLREIPSTTTQAKSSSFGSTTDAMSIADRPPPRPRSPHRTCDAAAVNELHAPIEFDDKPRSNQR